MQSCRATQILKDLSSTALIAAIESNRIAFSLNLGRLPRVKLHSSAESDWFITNASFAMANQVARTQFTGGDIAAKIEETLSHFKARGVPMIWWVGPMMHPANLATLLEAHGLTGACDIPGMAADLRSLHETPAPRGLTVERVDNAESLAKWIAIIHEVFHFPDSMCDLHFQAYAHWNLARHCSWYHYLGWLDGEPVAVSSLLLAAGVAGIWAVATVPDARGKGIGAEMTLAPLREARALGYRVGILNSSPMGFDLYRKLGFQEYCKVGFYSWDAER
ncbi:MAG: GNAT family N-acetyltransferase [Chloroflexi bacterium]|nr:GNAT family N-acetyltransferase [Chloroflexota bacterium]